MTKVWEQYYPDKEEVVFGLGNSRVYTNCQDNRFSSRLFVNHGETATTTAAKHGTREGARRWAIKTLAEHEASKSETVEPKCEGMNALIPAPTPDDALPIAMCSDEANARFIASEGRPQ